MSLASNPPQVNQANARAVSAAAGALGARVPTVARLSLSLQALDFLTDDKTAQLVSGLAAVDVLALEVREWPGCAANRAHVVDGRLSSLLARLPGLRELDVYGIGSLYDARRVRRREKGRGARLSRCCSPLLLAACATH